MRDKPEKYTTRSKRKHQSSKRNTIVETGLLSKLRCEYSLVGPASDKESAQLLRKNFCSGFGMRLNTDESCNRLAKTFAPNINFNFNININCPRNQEPNKHQTSTSIYETVGNSVEVAQLDLTSLPGDCKNESQQEHNEQLTRRSKIYDIKFNVGCEVDLTFLLKFARPLPVKVSIIY